MPLAHYDMECGPKCRSRRHAQDLNASITKGTLREIQAYFRLCHNAGHVTDTFHRTPLHLAASCGKIDVVEWLLTSKKSELTIRDEESGWTALHRALFYGQLAVARRLLHEVTDLTVRDREGLGPLDIVMKDRPGHVTFSLHDQNEVYSWGDNSNLTLGHSVEQRRSLPEPVDTFRRLQLNVKQVVLNKYHTVFLTSCGKVLTCGHGQGGRLGHNDEQPCLVPRVVEALQKQVCTQIAAARDHTVFLMEGGLVYTCGLNDCHQLGQFPLPPKSLFPKPVNAKVLKGKKVTGICAGRFHTGVMTSVPGSPDAVYTFGLNAGQLGHGKGDKFQSQPRLVAALNYEGLTIQKLSGSDAAIVCMTSTGDIFVCHEYQCRKITSKWQETVKIEVSGGRLDYNSDRDMLREYGGTELIIALLSCTGQVFVWKETSPVITRCHWAIRRNLQVTDMSLSSQNIVIVTHEGEGLIGHFTGRRRTTSQHVKTTADPAEGGNFENQTLMDLLLKDPTEEVHVTRVPHIYRATSVTTDRKGRNYVITQTTPISSLTDVPCVSSSTMARDLRTLLEEADQMDVIHDVVLKAGHVVFPAHKYILAYRSEYFRKHFESETADTEEQITEIHLDDDVHPVIFKQLLNFIYTDTCDLMRIGARFELPTVQYLDSTGDIFDFEPHVDFEMKSGQHKSASHKPQASQKGKSKHKKKNGVKVKVNEMGDGHKKSQNGKTPVKLLQDLAKKFSVKGLSKRLEAVKYVDGGIQSTGKSLPRPSITFDRTKLPFLYDVSIRGDSGEVVRCHKAIAVARLEYFHSMMASGWMETSNTASLSLPIQGDVLVTVLDFLYSGDAPEVRGCVDTERLCDVLVVADQLLITPLKEMCEVALATLLTLKNAGDMLEFASMYNAGQLRATCQQYISLNLAAILEARGLDVLSDDVMSELTEYYKNMIPGMCRRVITPYDEGPDRDYLGGLAAEFHGEDEDFTAGETAKRKQKAKKKRTQRKSVSEESTTVPSTIQKERPQSISSEISVKSEEDETDLLSVTPEDRNTKIMASAIPTLNGRGLHQSRAWPDLVSPAVFTSRITTASPPSPGSEVNLRGIMSQEVAASKHTDGQKPSSVTPKKSSKLSQKERKRLATAQSQRSPQPEQSPSQAPCPWGGVASSGHAPWSSSVSHVVQSFRDLMLEDKTVSEPVNVPVSQRGAAAPIRSPTSPSSAGVISWGLPTSGLQRPRQHSTGSAPAPTCTSPSSPSENPWLGKSPPSGAASLSFSQIVQDERQRHDNLVKNSNKPLSLIQIEERAMQELLQHYGAGENLDERITVERVSSTSATPLWDVHKK